MSPRADGPDLDRELVHAMREAGRALLEEGPGAGARVAGSWIARWTQARSVVMWPAPGAARWPGAWEESGPRLPPAAAQALHGDRLAAWEEAGRDAPPELLTDSDPPVLLLPLWGVRGVIGSIVVELGTARRLPARVLSTVRTAADLLGIGLEVAARAEAARETERRLRRFLDNLPDPAFVLDAGGRIVEVSRTVDAVVGRDAAELVGAPLATMVAPGEAERIETILGHARESGSARAAFTVPGRRSGEIAWLELHVQRIDEDRLLAVARDVTVRVRREHSLRVVLEHLPEIVAADGPAVLWRRLWRAVKTLLPRATHLWVYRAHGSRIRMEWSTRPDAPRWEFAVRGWGPEVGKLLQQAEASQAFVRYFGPTEDAARRTLERLIRGSGSPLLLGDPVRQLSVFLSENELDAIVRFWGDRPPGQLIHCPVLVNGRLELLVVVDAPSGERPFSYEDAVFAWQLVNVAQQALARLEAAALARRQLEEGRTFREALREVGESARLVDLVERVAQRAAAAVHADRYAVYEHLPGGRWALLWGRGIEARAMPELPGDAGNAVGAVFLADVATDRGWQEVAGEDARSLAAVPLVALGRLLGALVVASRRRLPWGAAQRELMGFFADELSLVLSELTLKRRVGALEAVQAELFRGVEGGVVLLDRAGRLGGLGGRAAELLGIAGAAAGQPLLEVLPPAVAEVLAPVLERSLAASGRGTERVVLGGAEVEVEIRPAGDGGVVWRLRDFPVARPSPDVIRALEGLGCAAAVVDGSGQVVVASERGQRAAAAGEAPAAELELAGGWRLRLWPAPERLAGRWAALEERLARLTDLATAVALRCGEGDGRTGALARELAEGLAEATRLAARPSGRA